MTVIAMSRTEIDRMSVLQDLATGRITVAEAATLMGLAAPGVPAGQGVCRSEARRRWSRGGAAGRATAAIRRLYAMRRLASSGALRGLRPDPGGEKLAERHGIHLGRETVRQWMIAAGLWRDRRARLKPVHQPRYRRDCVGELVQIDGSEHWWFEESGAAHAPCSSTLTMPPAG